MADTRHSTKTRTTDSTPLLVGAYIAVCAFAALLICYQVRSGQPFGKGVAWVLRQQSSPGDPLIRYGMYALCWGCLGACVNSSTALGKHISRRTFDDAWITWYVVKPPLGALTGLLIYVLGSGLNLSLGLSGVKNGFGIASVAFLAGFATERVALKVDELSKTLFVVPEEQPSLSILEPAEGKQVQSGELAVSALATGAGAFVSASCLEEPGRAVPLIRRARRGGGSLFEASLPLMAPEGDKTLQVTLVCDGKTLTTTTRFHHSHPA